MIFEETALKGAWLIHTEPKTDKRGFFERTFCEREFNEHGLDMRFVQHSISYSRAKATLRGMHFQKQPYSETKLVQCIQGAIYDVIIDLRTGSPTYKQWIGIELTNTNGCQLYVPKGFAHGFQTLHDDTKVHYLISNFYVPGAASGVKYDDHAFEVEWPLSISEISDADKTWPTYQAQE